MEIARTTVAGLAVATVVVGVAVTGCSNGNKSSSSSSSAASSSSTASSSSSNAAAAPSEAQPTDYSALLIKASDIGPGVTTPQPPVLNPNGASGVAQLFASPDGKDKIGDTILIVADPATAATGAENTKANYASKVTGTWQPADVGSNGAFIAGTAPDNSTVSVLVFTEGKALVNMEFDGPPNDWVDPGVAMDLGRKQDAAIKNGMPSQ